MKPAEYAVPAQNKSSLFLPPLAEYGKVLKENIAMGRDARISDTPLEELAKEARAKALHDARDYTESLGFDAGPDNGPLTPVIASGHQPIIMHPGVALKSMVLARKARELGASALFISVDSDEFKGHAVPAPVFDGAFAKEEAELFPRSGGAIYETAQVETPDHLIKRLKEYKSLLARPILATHADAMESFLGRLRALDLEGKDHTARAIMMRRAWEAPVSDGFMELPVSRLCGEKPFLKFTADILRRAKDFAAIYNSELARYRKEHKLRYPANPFPDLETGEDRIETPFWINTDNGRERLYAHFGESGVTFSGETTPEQTLDDLMDGSVAVRPRAIALSIYIRLFICDLFIHGVGGSKYDTITDPIIERFYGITPPRYACVSGTLWLDGAPADYADEIEELKQKLRNLEQHPEKALAEAGAALAAEKAELIGEIKQPGADKKKIGARISELNREMSELLAPEKLRLESRIENLEEKEKSAEAARCRDYPFFIHDPAMVLSLLE